MRQTKEPDRNCHVTGSSENHDVRPAVQNRHLRAGIDLEATELLNVYRKKEISSTLSLQDVFTYMFEGLCFDCCRGDSGHFLRVPSIYVTVTDETRVLGNCNSFTFSVACPPSSDCSSVYFLTCAGPAISEGGCEACRGACAVLFMFVAKRLFRRCPWCPAFVVSDKL